MSSKKTSAKSSKSTSTKPAAPKKVAAKVSKPAPVQAVAPEIAPAAAAVVETPATISAPISSGLFAGMVPAKALKVAKPKAERKPRRGSTLEAYRAEILAARAQVPPFSYKEIANVVNADRASKGLKPTSTANIVQFIRLNEPSLVKTRKVKEVAAVVA